jgi:undecaprenyl-diphosphatase
VKHKREIRANTAARRWFLISAGAVLLLLASFYLDEAVLAWMAAHQNGGVRTFMEAVSRFGDWPGHIALGVVLMGIAFFRGNKRWVRIFAVMVLACALAGVTTRVIKISTGRARPNVESETRWNGPRFDPRHNAFPSGHTAASTGFFATLAFACGRLGLGLLSIPLVVAFSRMYVGAHHLSDVVAAAFIGALAAYFLVRRLLAEKREP